MQTNSAEDQKVISPSAGQNPEQEMFSIDLYPNTPGVQYFFFLWIKKRNM